MFLIKPLLWLVSFSENRLDCINLSPNKCFPKCSEDNVQHSLILDDKEEKPGCHTQSSVENIFPIFSRESKIKALENKLGVHKEVKNTQVQETLPMIHHQSIPALPKSPSSPDVIIEEIFEDDLESKFLNTWCFQCSVVKYDIIYALYYIVCL